MDWSVGFVVMGFILIQAALIIVYANKYYSEREKNLEQRIKFSDLSAFIFEHALFSDDEGKATGDYNSPQVASKWDTFHQLTRRFYGQE